MRYVEIGSMIICNNEEVKVVDKYQEGGRSYFVLKTSKGLKSVPAGKIIWNGKNNFVTADGYVVSNLIAEAEKVISGIKEKMKTWDSENLNPVGFHREEAIDNFFMEYLRNELDVKSDKQIGFIVKKVVKALEEI